MSRKLRRRVAMAAGACIAGTALPIAAAFNAWADIEITYDGKIVYDDYAGAPAPGESDAGTAALSGTNNDWAVVIGPYANAVGLADDSATNDSNDFALYSGTLPATAFYGSEGATLVNATNSGAIATGDSNAFVNPAFIGQDPVSNGWAVASNGGLAAVSNDGLAPPGVTVANDYAFANGTGQNVMADGTPGTTPTIASVYDSGNSWASANDTGYNYLTGNGGAAVDLATNSSAYAVNDGSAANVIGTAATAVNNSSNIVGDGNVYDILTSNTYEIDGIPYFTFVGDLFGVGGATAFTTAWADLAQLLF